MLLLCQGQTLNKCDLIDLNVAAPDSNPDIQCEDFSVIDKDKHENLKIRLRDQDSGVVFCAKYSADHLYIVQPLHGQAVSRPSRS